MIKHTLDIQLLNRHYQPMAGCGDILWQPQTAKNDSPLKIASSILRYEIEIFAIPLGCMCLTNVEENPFEYPAMLSFLQQAVTSQLSIEQALHSNSLAQFSFSDKILFQIPYTHFVESEKKILIKGEKIASFSKGYAGECLSVFSTNLQLMIEGSDKITAWIPGVIEQIYVKTSNGYQLSKILTTNRALQSFVAGKLTFDLFSSTSLDLDQGLAELQKRLQIGFVEDAEAVISLLDTQLLLVDNIHKKEFLAVLKQLFECLNSSKDDIDFQAKVELIPDGLSKVFSELENNPNFFIGNNSCKYKLQQIIMIIGTIFNSDKEPIPKVKILFPDIQNQLTHIVIAMLPSLIEYQKNRGLEFLPKNLSKEALYREYDFKLLYTHQNNFLKNKLLYYQFSQYCEANFAYTSIQTYFSIINYVQRCRTTTSDIPHRIAELTLTGRTKNYFVCNKVSSIIKGATAPDESKFITEHFGALKKQALFSTKAYHEYFSFTEQEIAKFSKISKENILSVADQLIEAKIDSLAEKTQTTDGYSRTHFRYYYNRELIHVLKRRQLAKIIYLDSEIVNKISILNNKHYHYEMLAAVSIILGGFIATAALTIALFQTSAVIFPAAIVLNSISVSTQHLVTALGCIIMAVEIWSVKHNMHHLNQINKNHSDAESVYVCKNMAAPNAVEFTTMLLPDQKTLAPVW